MARPHASMLKTLLRSSTALAAALAFYAMSAEPAAAQQPPPAEQAEPVEEEIVITGSRIARPANVDAPTQVTTIGVEEIQASGLTNAADILRTVPSFGVPALSTTNSNFLTSGAGVNTLQL